MQMLRQKPPCTRTKPVFETLHGMELVDPYRWLEQQHSNATRQWISDQTAYTRAYLDSLPERKIIRQRVSALLRVVDISDAWQMNGMLFYLKRREHEEQPSIFVRPASEDLETALVSPGDGSQGMLRCLQIVSISPDARFLAFGLRLSGTDTQSIGFVDVQRRELLRDRLPEGYSPGLVFTANPPGFYYTHEAIESRDNRRAVFWHRFGQPSSSDEEIFFGGYGPHLHLGVIGSTDARVLIYMRLVSHPSTTLELYAHDIGEQRKAQKLLDATESIVMPFFVDQTLCAMTNLRAPNSRIVKIDVNSPAPERWQDLIPESSAAIKEVSIAGQHICVHYAADTQSTVKVFDMHGQCVCANACPSTGTAKFFTHCMAGEKLFYTFSSFVQPPTVYALDPVTGQQEMWSRQDVGIDLSNFGVNRGSYPSFDKTTIPMFLVADKRYRSTGTLPTFVTGYGGFGASATPKFNAYSAFLLEQGFLFAVANIRGGGELGKRWHESAKRHHRQTAFDDFICGTEWLIRTGRSDSTKMTIGGGSNGGLLVAAALTQRPDLFKAVLCAGPLLDMLRYHLFDTASLFANEYGTADSQSDFPHLYAYSPYHHVVKGTRYPAVLFISGDADIRCNAMHVRKMVAALQASTASERPILMQYTRTWGHTPVQPLTLRIDALADRLAFLLHELGIPPRKALR